MVIITSTSVIWNILVTRWYKRIMLVPFNCNCYLILNDYMISGTGETVNWQHNTAINDHSELTLCVPPCKETPRCCKERSHGHNVLFLWCFASTEHRGLWESDKKTGVKISEFISQGFITSWHSFKHKDFDFLHTSQNWWECVSWIALGVGQQEFPWRDIQVLLILDFIFVHNLSLRTLFYLFLYFIQEVA